MLLCVFRPPLKRVNHLGILASRHTRSLPQLTQKRQYATSSMEPESPATPKSASKKKKSAAEKKQPTPLPLPVAPPEPLTASLVESDYSVYLKPLYTRGWKLSACNMSVKRGEVTPGAGFVLTQIFRFQSTKDLLAFSKNTRNASFGRILLKKTPEESNIELTVSLLAPELTRGQIHLAIATETEYQKVAGRDFGVSPTPWLSWVRTPQRAQKMLSKYRNGPFNFLAKLGPITPVPLPRAPPAPVSSPPSITEGDLERYIAPLVTNGWSVRRFPVPISALRGHPTLHRIYSFHDYTSARHFVDAVITAIPATPHSYEWVELRLDSENPGVQVWSISELAEGAPKKYGISHVNVRFAMEVEHEFAKNWLGHADNAALPTRTLPMTMEELWNGKGKVQ